MDKAQLIDDVKKALYAAKICSYAQGMNIIKAKSEEKGWDINLGGLARIWKVALLRQPSLCCGWRADVGVGDVSVWLPAVDQARAAGF